MAEWSKALVLGTSLFGGVGSNPTAAKFPFLNHENFGCVQLDYLDNVDTLLKGIGTSHYFLTKTCLFCALTIFAL